MLNSYPNFQKSFSAPPRVGGESLHRQDGLYMAGTARAASSSKAKKVSLSHPVKPNYAPVMAARKVRRGVSSGAASLE